MESPEGRTAVQRASRPRRSRWPAVPSDLEASVESRALLLPDVWLGAVFEEVIDAQAD